MAIYIVGYEYVLIKVLGLHMYIYNIPTFNGIIFYVTNLFSAVLTGSRYHYSFTVELLTLVKKTFLAEIV